MTHSDAEVITYVSEGQGRLPLRTLSAPFHKYGGVCGGGLPGEVEEREGGDAGHRRRQATKRSTATSLRPKGCGGTPPSSSLLLLADIPHQLVGAP